MRLMGPVRRRIVDSPAGGDRGGRACGDSTRRAAGGGRPLQREDVAGQASSFRVADSGKRILDLHFHLVRCCHRGSSFTTGKGRAPSWRTSSIRPNGGLLKGVAQFPNGDACSGRTAYTVTS
jgi:hypothetical protein